MFVYNNETHRFDSEKISVDICYDDLYDGMCDFQDSKHFERSRLFRAEQLEKAYIEKEQEIIDYMKSEGLLDFYGEYSDEEIKEKLGKPVIDIGREVVMYIDNTFKPYHIIEFEFISILDKLCNFTIDG